MYYYGYRYYEPEVGRWLTRDPIENEGGLNLYCYILNDPVDGIDFLGLEKLILTYLLKTDEAMPVIDRRRMPKNIKASLNMTHILEDIEKQISGEYDPKGECGNCILKVTIAGHSGMPGNINLGENYGDYWIINPDVIQNRGLLLNKINKNPKSISSELGIKFLKQIELENTFFTKINGYMCEEDAIIDFAQCSSYLPETKKYIKKFFSDNVEIKLHSKGVYFSGGEVQDEIFLLWDALRYWLNF